MGIFNRIRQLGRDVKGFLGVTGSSPMAQPAGSMAQRTQHTYMETSRLRGQQIERRQIQRGNEARNSEYWRVHRGVNEVANKLHAMLDRNSTQAPERRKGYYLLDRPQSNIDIRKRDSYLGNLVLDTGNVIGRKTFRPDTREGREFIKVREEFNTAYMKELKLRQSMKKR